MTKFIVGDRVSVYSWGSPNKNYGTVAAITDDGDLRIFYDQQRGVLDLYAHPKQCRKLKKAGSSLRKIYVIVTDYSTFTSTAYWDRTLAEKFVKEGEVIKEFQEVKK